MPEQIAERTADYVVGPVENIPIGEGRTAVVAGERIAIFHSRSGRVYAVQATCPHQGGPLADGILAGSTIVCPLHEFRFNLSDGAPQGNPCDRLRTYDAWVDDAGQVVVRL